MKYNMKASGKCVFGGRSDQKELGAGTFVVKQLRKAPGARNSILPSGLVAAANRDSLTQAFYYFGSAMFSIARFLHISKERKLFDTLGQVSNDLWWL